MKLGNTFTRILVALISIPGLLAICYFGEIYFLIFTMTIALGSYYEFALMAKIKDSYASRTVGFSAIAAIVLNNYYGFIEEASLFIIIILALSIVELFRNKESAIFNIGVSLFGILYLGLFSSSLLSLREYYQDENYIMGGYLIVSIFLTIWACDSAAFFVGTAIGKHKLFPRVSPNKSWEGAIAGFVFSILVMILAKIILLDVLSMTDAVVIGIIVGVFGQAGDLIESLIKRDAGVKDSSSIIPGHGGIFDRFDSIFFSAPVIFLYITLF